MDPDAKITRVCRWWIFIKLPIQRIEKMIKVNGADSPKKRKEKTDD